MESYDEKQAGVKGGICVLDASLLAERASEGLLGLSVELGLEVIRQLMEDDATALAGEKGKHQPGRGAYRHGYEDTKVVCGGQKLPVRRPRVRSKAGAELPLPSLMAFQRDGPLNRAVLAHVLAGVATRKYAGLQGRPDGACRSKSEVSRRFIAGMKERAGLFFSRRLDADYIAVILDGMMFSKVSVVAAMGITDGGRKEILGITQGGSENAEVAKGLLGDLVGRGLDAARPRLYVIDGSKALHKAVMDTFGASARIQRCQVHKKRNVLAHLPDSEKGGASISLSCAYKEFDYEKAKAALERLHGSLAFRYPKAAGSLMEGIEETLAVHRLGVPGLLRQTLSNTNALESANAVCAQTVRRVSAFKDGETALRHAAAGFMEAERGFHRVRGYRQIPFLKSRLQSFPLTENGKPDMVGS